jgi:mannose-6-phosphate isomerase-like protein (cupin superfamily)
VVDRNARTVALSATDLFRSLDRASLSDLADTSVHRKYRAKEFVFEVGQPADALYVVVQGSVALSVRRPDGGDDVLDTRQSPAAFGEAALWDGGPRMVSARAVDDADVLEIPSRRFKALVRSNPDIAEALLTQMASVIRRRTRGHRQAERARVTGGPADQDVRDAHDYLAPDGSEIRLLTSLPRGGLAHCTLPAGATSASVRHRTVDEIWFFLEGNGQLWRSDRAEPVDVRPGQSLAIRCGVSFRFRNTGDVPLRFIIATMPEWPGAEEAEPLPTAPWT